MKAALFAVMMLFVLLQTSCKEVIMHNLDEAQANKVSIILHEYSIEAEKIKSGNNWNIQVDAAQAFSALQILDKNRFLKRLSSKTKEHKNGLMVSREERQRWIEREQAFNLEETLEAVPEILEARIHFYFNQPNDFDSISKFSQRTASVLLVTGGKNKSANKPEVIKELAVKLISGATGIQESAISIVVASESTFNLASKQVVHSLMPPEMIFIGVASLVLCLCVIFIIRRKSKKMNKEDDSDEAETMTVAETDKSSTEGSEKHKTGSEIDIKPHIITGDLNGFRQMNQELF